VPLLPAMHRIRRALAAERSRTYDKSFGNPL
jgi:hypothetical protein